MKAFEIFGTIGLKDSGFEEGLKKKKEKLTGFAAKLKDTGASVEKFGKSLLPITAAFTAFGTAAFASANSIDNAFSEIRKSSGATGEALESLKGSFKTVFADVPQSAAEVADVLATMNTLTGVTGGALEKLTKKTLDYARANNEDAAQSAATLGRLMNALDIDVSESTQLMDMLTKASQDTGLGVNTLSDYLIAAGPSFEEMGFGVERATALFAQFYKSGAEPQELLSSLNILLNKMAKEGLTDAEAAFNDLLESIKAAPDILSATTIASEMFGSRVGAKVADDIMAGRFEIDEYVEALKMAEGTLEATAEESLKFSEKLSILKNQAALAFEPFGSTIIDMLTLTMNTIKPLIDWLTRLGEKFAELDETTQRVIIGIGLFVAGLGPAIVIIGKLISVIGTVITVVKTLKVAMVALNVVMKANPVLAIISAIVLAITVIGKLISVLVKLYQTSEKARDIMKKAFDALPGPIKIVINLIGKAINKFRELIGIADDVADETEYSNSRRAISTVSANNAMMLSYENYADGVVESEGRAGKARDEAAEKQRSLIEKMIAAEQKYQDELERRTASIVNSMKRVGEAQEKEERERQNRILAARLRASGMSEAAIEGITRMPEIPATMQSIQDQTINALEKWADDLQTLASKGVEEGIIDELRTMTPEARKQMDELLKMTEGQLSRYTASWKKTHELARKIAKDELKDMRRETDKEISAMMAEFASTGGKGGKKLGEDIIKGAIEGLKSKEGELKNTLTKMLSDLEKLGNKTLEISSPSKKFFRMFQNVGKGAISGLKSMESKIQDTLSSVFDYSDYEDISFGISTPSETTTDELTEVDITDDDGRGMGQVINNFTFQARTALTPSEIRRNVLKAQHDLLLGF